MPWPSGVATSGPATASSRPVGEPVRHPPEIGHLARSADHRIEQANQAENEAGHALHPHRPLVDDARPRRRCRRSRRYAPRSEIPRRRRGDRAGRPTARRRGQGRADTPRHAARPFGPGARMTPCPALLAMNAVSQLCPEMVGPKKSPARKMQVRTRPARAASAKLRSISTRILPFSEVGAATRVRRQPVRHPLAKAVDVAGKQVQRPEPFGDGQRGGIKRPRQLRPAMIGRIEPVEDDVRQASQLAAFATASDVVTDRPPAAKPNPAIRRLSALSHQSRIPATPGDGILRRPPGLRHRGRRRTRTCPVMMDLLKI